MYVIYLPLSTQMSIISTQRFLQMSELLTLTLRLRPATLRRNFIVFVILLFRSLPRVHDNRWGSEQRVCLSTSRSIFPKRYLNSFTWVSNSPSTCKEQSTWFPSDNHGLHGLGGAYPHPSRLTFECTPPQCALAVADWWCQHNHIIGKKRGPKLENHKQDCRQGVPTENELEYGKTSHFGYTKTGCPVANSLVPHIPKVPPDGSWGTWLHAFSKSTKHMWTGSS